MRVLITTMHRGYNPGSALQTYALCEKIKMLGHEPLLLDYVPERVVLGNALKGIFAGLFKGAAGGRLHTFVRSLAKTLSNERVYNRFFNRYVRKTRRYYSLAELRDAHLQADVYMTGSDQVWNSFHNQGIDEVFYLEFAPQGVRCVAYAASFGKSRLDSDEMPVTRRLLAKYQMLSVREASGVDILRSLGLEGCHVLDPTFLLDRRQWQSVMPPIGDQGRYVLIYSVEPDKENTIAVARAVADRLGAKVFMVEWGRNCPKGVDRIVHNVDPLELMAYFDNAAFVVASSFHGTAISVDLNKPFLSIAPARFGGRVESLLDMVGQRERLLRPGEPLNIDDCLKPVAWDSVNAVMEAERAFSVEYLKKAIEQ